MVKITDCSQLEDLLRERNEFKMMCYPMTTQIYQVRPLWPLYQDHFASKTGQVEVT